MKGDVLKKTTYKHIVTVYYGCPENCVFAKRDGEWGYCFTPQIGMLIEGHQVDMFSPEKGCEACIMEHVEWCEFHKESERDSYMKKHPTQVVINWNNVYFSNTYFEMRRMELNGT